MSEESRLPVKKKAAVALPTESLEQMLRRRFPPAKICTAVAKLFRAEVVRYSPRGEEMDRRPDTKAIAQAVKFVLEYTEGTPVKRVFKQTVVSDGRADLSTMIEQSAEVRAAIESLARREKREKGSVIEAELSEGADSGATRAAQHAQASQASEGPSDDASPPDSHPGNDDRQAEPEPMPAALPNKPHEDEGTQSLIGRLVDGGE